MAVIQSLLVTCKLQDIDPYTYLVNVFQQAGEHSVKDVIKLTQQNW